MDDLDDNQPDVEENDVPSPAGDDDGDSEGEGGPGGGDEDATWGSGQG